MRRSLLALGIAAVIATAAVAAALTAGGSHAARPPVGIHKIKHVIVIMQENRSFDQLLRHLPRRGRHPAQRRRRVRRLRPDPATGTCVKPYHDTRDRQRRRPARAGRAAGDIDGGQDGRLRRPGRDRQAKGCRQDPTTRSARRARRAGRHGLPRRAARSRTTGRTRATSSSRTTCSSRTPRGACRRTCSWSRSGRRSCTSRDDPMSCVNALQNPGRRRTAAQHDRRRTTRGPT